MKGLTNIYCLKFSILFKICKRQGTPSFHILFRPEGRLCDLEFV